MGAAWGLKIRAGKIQAGNDILNLERKMPSIKDFDKNKNTESKHGQKHEPKAAAGEHMAGEASGGSHKKAKRRPGRDQEIGEGTRMKVVDVDVATSTHAEEEAIADSSSRHSEPSNGSHADEKVEIAFPGSEILRSRFPMPFQIAEGIATDWVKDGSFEGLPVGHPLAQFFLAKGLRKAKDIEKKVIESPVTEKVTMQVLQAGLKATSQLASVKEQVDQAKTSAKSHVNNLKKKIGRA